MIDFPFSPVDIPDLFWSIAGSLSARDSHGKFPSEVAPVFSALRKHVQPLKLAFTDLRGNHQTYGMLEEYFASDRAWEAIGTDPYGRSAFIYFVCSAAFEMFENGFCHIDAARRAAHKERLQGLMDFLTEAVRRASEDNDPILLVEFEKCIGEKFIFTIKRPKNQGFVAPQFNFDQHYLLEFPRIVVDELQKAMDLQMQFICDTLFQTVSERMSVSQMNEFYNALNDRLAQEKNPALFALGRAALNKPTVSRHFRHRAKSPGEIVSQVKVNKDADKDN